MGLLKFIIIVLFVYAFVKVFTRFLLPILLGILISRSTNAHQRNNQWNNYRKNEGQVTIKGKKTKSRFSEDEGEYVDFEDVKE